MMTGAWVSSHVPFKGYTLNVLPDPVRLISGKGTDYYALTQRVISSLGGIEKFVKKNASVGILINSDFDLKGTYTHPDIALAVLKLCKDAGAKEITLLQVVKAGYWTRGFQGEHHQALLKEIKQVESNVFPAKFNNDDYVLVSPVPGAFTLKEAEVVKKCFECDIIISIPIAKHHSSTIMTGTLKNMMGITSRKTNVTFHLGSGVKNDPEYLARCIADLNKLVKPGLIITDATVFITNNGPEGPGDLNKLDKIIATNDPVASDAYCAMLLDYRPDHISSVKAAYDLGVGEMDMNKIIIEEVTV
jgi:uncharacterized protein (DUF362 family)